MYKRQLANTVFNSSGTTVSGFLGALVAGFVAGYIVLLLRKIFSKLPESLEGIKPTLLYPVLGVFIMGALMLFVFNPIIGVINDALAKMCIRDSINSDPQRLSDTVVFI